MYPVVLTKEEFFEKTGIDIDEQLGLPNVNADIFLDTVSMVLFENAIYSSGNKERVNRIIAKYDTVSDQIKELLYKVGEYMLREDNIHLYSGLLALESGDEILKDNQEIIQKILPPNTRTYVMNIVPSISYAGGANV